jgi:2-methylisocitrate lyase-like PEP mutase family enzyme
VSTNGFLPGRPQSMSGAERRRRLRAAIGSGPVFAPLCLDALTARLCSSLGYRAGYVGGGALGFSTSISEALLDSSDLAATTTAISRRSDLPLIVDVGCGFGDPLHVARTVWDMELAGAAAIEVEDQVAPKQIAHHRGEEAFVTVDEMVAKVKAAVQARVDENLVVIARTGVARNEGIGAALDRLVAYRDAGADLFLMPFISHDDRTVAAGSTLAGRLVAIAPLHRPTTYWSDLGYALVLDSRSTQVVAFEAKRRQLERQVDGDGEMDVDELDRTYATLADFAGFAELFEIEGAAERHG